MELNTMDGFNEESDIITSPNKINQFVRIISEELIKELKDNARVTCVIEPGTINSTGTGASPSGSVVVNSVNTFPSIIMGIIE